jgi:glycosyltransferase involved in cell wall biosynthesis
VLVSHSELGYLLLPYLRAFCLGPTYIDFCHNVEEYWKNGGYPQMSAGSHEQLDLTMVSSQHLKQWMVRRGAPAERIEVCYTNIDPEEWQPDRQVRAKTRQELGISDEIPVILYAGRLCRQKQPKVFAQVMKQLHERGLEFRALVAGGGENRAWLESFMLRRHLREQVRVLGSASRERMRALMMTADIFFLPSAWEGIALTMYEAMACGLTVIGADVGGQRELVTKGCGVLFPPSEEKVEVQQYTDTLAEFLADPGRRAVMGQQARSRICEHFRLEGMGDRMLALFEEARFLRPAHPRPAVSPGLGLACATQAVEYMRLHQVADMLWLEREGRKEKGLPLSALFYLRLRRIGRPLYLWGLQRGWHWMTPLKDLIKRRLLTRFGQSV